MANDRYYTGRFYNIGDFENYLLEEGADRDCPEFTMYDKRCRAYEAKELGLDNGKKYYEATHVEKILMEDQGFEFTNLVKANVPQTIIIDY